MDDLSHIARPLKALEIQRLSKASGFQMSCDDLTGNLLRTLISTKPRCKALELGTGVGYSTCWLLDGMDSESCLVTVESEEQYANIAKDAIGDEHRLTIIVSDGADFIRANLNQKFDFIFADTWPGKFYLLEEALGMLSDHGVFIIDDLNRQDNWPEGHKHKVEELIHTLDQRDDLLKLKMNWSTGIMIITKKKK